ncbi:MAG TPA: N-acetylglutaminylglutamine amidotransferase [Egibacteraceae bacterium]|nr:N-acetylglutaminylglutamine amidotransferase [Actinomycetota bacterium]HWB71926.1 N-acetylglutaminylglutamine amidotransferase [Egibacteraceae bacterium]
MCGIGGELRTDGGRPDLAAVDRMTAALSHRGPDGEGAWNRGGVALGHRRLSILDLSERAAQPMTDEQLGLTIVYNGLVYNYEELRRRLQSEGMQFRSDSDTEVLLKAYHAWGPSFVERLNGMFAFCLAEHASGRLLLARDRLGIKPLYLSRSPGRLRFASSLPALLAAGDVDTAVDPVALHHYLTWHAVVPAPRTILAGVRKLAPATLLTVECDGAERQHLYWEPTFVRRPDRADWSAGDWADAVLAALRTAVARRLVAHVPVGVLLSGGLDSSLIVGLLAEVGQRGLASFSVGFEQVEGASGDEFHYSDLVARTFGTDHHRIRVPADRLLEALADAVAAMSEPMVSHDVVGFYLLGQEVAAQRKVVQSGQGADEVFAGYHWYPPMTAPDADVDTYVRCFFDRDHAQMGEVVAPDYLLDADPSRTFVERHFAADGAATAADRALRLDTTVMLVDDPVKRVDNMTMAWGLEARVPFMDHELVELAAVCPPELKVADGGKAVLKRAARGLVPDAVIDRPKGSFPVPALTHLEGPYLDLVVDALRAPEAKARGLFRKQYVDRLVADPNAEMTPLGGNKLWQLGLLELWLQSHGVRP